LVQRVSKVAIQSAVITGMIVAAAISIAPVMADEWLKTGALTCDEANNRAMARLSAGYSRAVPPVSLPETYAPHFAALNSLPVKQKCTFKDGREISLSWAEGQAFAYGQNGADASASFTLKVNDKFAYYNKVFYGGHGVYGINPSAVLLDGDKLIACSGTKDDNVTPNESYKITAQDCSDVSERLGGSLSGFEQRQLERDQEIARYKPVNLNRAVCSYFSQKDVRDDLETDKYDRFSFHVDGVTREFVDRAPYPFGYLEPLDIDVDNDGIAEAVYRLGATSHYFDGSLLVFSKDKDQEKSFLNCATKGDCPAEFPRDKEGKSMTGDVDYFVAATEKLWPRVHLISAESLHEYAARYTWLYPVTFSGKTYIYYVPLLHDEFPSSMVAMLKPNNELETICTYKDYDGSTR
jgi:hypothetical protein